MHTIIHPSGWDDTPAIASALAHAGSVAEFVRGCVYTFGDLKPPNGSTLVGLGGTNYTDPQAYNTPRIVALPGCASIFDFSDPNCGRSVTMSGLMLDGVDASCYGISAGSCHLTLERMYIVNCLIGIGGKVAGGSSYTYVLIADKCKIVNCARYGVDSPVDSELAHCICANNGVNVHALPGANANRIDSGRYEWPTSGENFRLDGEGGGAVSDWIFAGPLQMDRAALCSVAIRNGKRIQFGVISSGRPGRAGATDRAQSCHIYCEDSRDITATGMQLWAGADDDGGGVYSPAHAWQFAGVNRNVVLCGGSVADGYTGDRAIDYLDGNTPESMPGHRIACVGGLANFHH